MYHIRAGYAALNVTLRDKSIFTGRTARLKTIKEKGTKFALGLLKHNLQDLLLILKWNEAHNIKFYRMSSGIAPHITNPALLSRQNRKDYKKLAYSLETCRHLLHQIGQYAKTHGHRLTFHPDPFISLGTSDSGVLLRNMRELYFHALILDMMDLDMNSVVIIHGGGVYGDKPAAIKRWVKNFNQLPVRVKRRLVLENDEFSYSVEDCLQISRSVASYPVEGFRSSSRYKIPIVLDIFHYYCYNRTIQVKDLLEQKSIKDLLSPVLRSWGSRQIKMHISEQRKGGRVGHHADYVKNIPMVILTFPKKYKSNLDIMIEAKLKEKSVLYLKKKYKAVT